MISCFSNRNMNYKRKGNLIFTKLDRDEEILESLKEICRHLELETAIVLSGVGQLHHTTLGYYKGKGDYTPEVFEETYELLSMTGTIIHQPDGDYIPHIHVVLGEVDKNTIGGHLIKGLVGVTCEITLLTSNISIKRSYNPETGLKEMVLD